MSKKEPVNRKAAIYCRISRDEEGEEVGVRRQEALCRDLAARLGLEAAAVFTDNDIGASDFTRRTKPRPQFAALLEAVRNLEVGHIVSYSNSRLTRRPAELEVLVDLATDTGVRINTVVSGGNADLGSSDGLMFARIMASVDAGEAHRISERMKAALLHKARTGEPRVTSMRPFGWLPDGKTPDPVEAKLIQEGVRDLIAGASVNTIRKRWEAQGVRTPSGGERWHWTNTLSVLTSWRTVGIRTYNGEVLLDGDSKPVRGKWEALVTEEDREAALLQVSRRRVSRTQPRTEGSYLLSGLVRCGLCGSQMWGSTGTGKRKDSYLCSGGSGHVAIDVARLNNHVWEEVTTRLLNRDIFSGRPLLPDGRYGPRPEGPPVDELEPWDGEDRLAEVVGRIGVLMAAYSDGTMAWETVAVQVGKLEQERNALREEQTRHRAMNAQPRRRSVESGQDILEWLKDFGGHTAEEQQEVIRQEVETIVIRKGVRGVASRTEEAFKARARIAWRPEPG